MAKIDSNKLVLHGVGEAVLLDQNGKASATLMKLQNMTIEITSETEDVYGGDSLFPFFNYVTSKSNTFTFTNAVFDMNVLAATQGAEVLGGGEAFGSEEVVVGSEANQLSVTAGIQTDSVICIADGVNLEADKFTCTEAGVLTFTEGVQAGTKVHVSYVYTTTDGSTVHVHTDDVAGYVELRHTSNPTELPDGTLVQLHTRVYKARCEGGLNIEYTRDGAVAPEVSFKSVDPERADKKFVSYSLVPVK